MLPGSCSYGANLSDADLTDANFSGAELEAVNFTGANLTAANLSNARINQNTNFTGAIYSSGTIWPYGFDPVAAGAILNDPPQNLAPVEPPIVSVNQPVGTVVGQFNATEPEGGVVTYHLLDQYVDGNVTIDLQGSGAGGKLIIADLNSDGRMD